MKKILFLILFIGFSTLVKSQQPPYMVEVINPEKFNLIVDTSATTSYTSVLETDSFYISTTSGNYNGSNDYYQSIFIKAVNKNYGYCLKKNLIIKSVFGIGFHISLIRLDSSNKFMLIAASSSFTGDSSFLNILCCRIKEATTMYMGFIDTLWSKTIYFNKYFGSAINNDSNFVLGVGSNYSIPYLFKLNKSNGNIVYDTLYSVLSGYKSHFNNIIKTNDNGYLSLGSAGVIGDGIHSSPVYTLFIKLNKNFQIEWITKFRPYDAPFSEFFEVYDAVQLADSGYLAAGCLSKPGIIRLDKNGNVKWWRRYHYNGGSSNSAIEFNNIYKLNNNKYILIGAADSVSYEVAFTYMLCIDSMGNEIWHRKLYGLREKYFFNNNSYNIRTIDGGFLIGGYIAEMNCIMFPKGKLKSYFIKTDSIGCDGCGSCDTLTKLTATFIVNSTDSIYHGSVPVNVSNPYINCKDTLCLGERILVKFKIVNGNDAYKYRVNVYGIYNDGGISSYDDCPSQLGLELLATVNNMSPNVTYSYLTEPFNNPYHDTLKGLFLYAYYNNNYYDSYEIGANTIDSTFGIFYGLRQYFRIDTSCVIGIPSVAFENNNINLYPNPASQAITVESEKQINGKLYIINNLGIVVKEEEIKHQSEKTLDIHDLPSGLYILKINENKIRFSIVK